MCRRYGLFFAHPIAQIPRGIARAQERRTLHHCIYWSKSPAAAATQWARRSRNAIKATYQLYAEPLRRI